MTEEQLLELPIHLSDPLMIVYSECHPEGSNLSQRFVVVTAIQTVKGDPVFTILALDAKQQNMAVTDIRSVYGKENFARWINNQAREGNIRYLNKKRSVAKLKHIPGLQLSSVIEKQRSLGQEILTEENDVTQIFPFTRTDTKYPYELSEDVPLDTPIEDIDKSGSRIPAHLEEKAKKVEKRQQTEERPKQQSKEAPRARKSNTRVAINDSPGLKPFASLTEKDPQASDTIPVAVVDVDPGIVPEFRRARDLAKWLKNSFADKWEEIILSTGKKVRFGNGNLEASIKRVREEAHNQAYAGLSELVRRAEYDSFESKDTRHPNLGGQEVYYSALRIGDTLYAVKFKMDVPSEWELQTRRDRRGEKNVEDLRYKDHALREIEIAPVLYRGVGPNTGGPTQATEAIRKISLGVLRDAVKSSRLENNILSSMNPGEFLPPGRKVGPHVRVSSAQIVVNKLQERAANAAETQVVQSFEELPEHIRQAYSDEASRLEGVYDPETGKVYLVADAIRGLGRVAEVWMHENLVHHGLNGLLSRGEKRRILNRLWQGMGGLGHADLKERAHQYGVDPRSDADARELVMEEYVANLAEKRAADKLSGKEQTSWRRFVEAVLRAWNTVVDFVAGRTSTMRYENLDRLLAALDRYVFEGKPDGIKQQGNMVPARASVDKAELTIEAAHRAWEQLQKDIKEWERQVDEFIVSKQTRPLLNVSRSPDVLRKLGAPDLPLTMTTRNLEKILSNKPDHGLPPSLVKQLPTAISEPVMVFESATSPDSFVVLTELKHEGRSVMAAVYLDTERQRIRVNDIASVYKRGSETWYLQQIEEGHLLYQDKKKSLAWARTNRLQLPQVRKLPARLSGKRILTEEDIVKPIAPDTQPQAPLHDMGNVKEKIDISAKKPLDLTQHLFQRKHYGKTEKPLASLRDNHIVGYISPEIAEKLRLNKPGYIILDEEGIRHAEQRHGKEIRSSGFADAQALISHVMANIDAIYQGNNNRTYELVAKARNPYARTIVRLEFSPEGDFYRVVTAGPSRQDAYKNKTPLWERAQSNHSLTGIPGAVSGQNSVSGKKNNLSSLKVNNTKKSLMPGEFLSPGHRVGPHVSLSAAKVVVNKLQERAANAAETQVVQSFEELPEHIRQAYSDEASRLESVYDPETGKVYLVADAMRGLGRVAEVWMHENLVHHGLNGLLSRGEKRRILNRLWQGMGGLGHADLKERAHRYGVDPRSNADARELVMEEYIANLAEKRAADKLSGKEQTSWRRFVEAVLRAWNTVVDFVAGRTGTMRYENLDRLLAALDRYVFEGKPDSIREQGGMASAMASVGEPGPRSGTEVAHRAWEQVQRDAEEWGRQVDAFRPYRGTEARQPQLMTVCRTPDVLQKLGAPDLPMVMTADNLGKVLSDKLDHGLPKDLVKQLPSALAEPVMVFESASEANSFVILTGLKHEGRSVMAAVHLDKEKQHIKVNDIASAYKRTSEAWYIRQIEEGRLLYQDKKKSLAWARTNRLQLPRVRKLPARLSGKRILTEEDIVKPIAPDTQPQAPLHDMGNVKEKIDISAKKPLDLTQHLFQRKHYGKTENPLASLRDNHIVGYISPEIAEKLRLNKPGYIILDEEGSEHIEEEHWEQIQQAGFVDVRQFVTYVLKNISAVYATDANRKYDLVAFGKEKSGRVLVRLIFDPEGDFYRVVTAGPVRKKFYKNKTLLWGSTPYNPSDESEPVGTPRAEGGQSNVSGIENSFNKKKVNDKKASIKPGEFLPSGHKVGPHIRASSAQIVVNKLQERAANAAETQVVQSFEELPEHIRQAYSDEASRLEGVYDPKTGKVYLVADAIRGLGRVAEVWMHENLVHHGLNGLLSRGEKRRILNRLWQGMGGLGHADLKERAHRYGVDPRSDADARELVMEEYIANLAEKRAADKLSGKEQTSWRRFVEAVLRAWNTVVDFVAGRTGTMRYENLDRLLAALDRYVFKGKPDGKREQSSMDPARASVDKTEVTIEVAHRAWEQLQKDTEKWGKTA